MKSFLSCIYTCLFLIFQLIFGSDPWIEQFDTTKDDCELNTLAEQLPTVISHCRASSTVKQYSSAFEKWKNWCIKHNKVPLPAEPYIISLYLTDIGNSAQSPSPINSAIASISWAHRMANFTFDPTKANIVKNTHEGLKRILAKPTKKKEPIELCHIQKMVEFYGMDKSINNLMNIRTLTMILISYAGFLRFSELVNIQLSHLTFKLSHLQIYIPNSKTDQYRQGNSVVIARTNSPTCPVNMMELYLKLVNAYSYGNSVYVFRNLSKTKDGFKFRSMNVPMTYSRVREIILEALKPFVGDISKYCIHSLRAGGATVAANSGLADRLFKRHGRWKSETAKDGYILDSLSSKLSVSKSLGL